MEKIFKSDYSSLFLFVMNNRKDLKERYNKCKKYKVEKLQEERLISLGYISWDDKSRKLPNPEFIITKKGMEYYLKLREMWIRDLNVGIAYLALFFSLVAIGLSLNTYIYTLILK